MTANTELGDLQSPTLSQIGCNLIASEDMGLFMIKLRTLFHFSPTWDTKANGIEEVKSKRFGLEILANDIERAWE